MLNKLIDGVKAHMQKMIACIHEFLQTSALNINCHKDLAKIYINRYSIRIYVEKAPHLG